MSQDMDRRVDAAFFERSIRHIADEALFASLDLSPPALSGVRQAVERGDHEQAYRAWGEYWPATASRGRFLGDGEMVESRAGAAESLRPRRDEILRAAERVMRHEINGWGDIVIQHGPVVDFDAEHGEQGKYGFHYWLWARPLVQAFLLTDQQRYLDEFEILFNQWFDQRDRVRGHHRDLDLVWYELGLGVRNRIFLEYYCLPQPARSLYTHARMLKTLLGAARWLYEEENRLYRGGNWQIMGSYGLMLIGLLVPEFRESEQWVRLGAQRLAEHAEKDFFADGCHSERCPSSYMTVAYRDCRNVARLLWDRPEYADLARRAMAPLERSLDFYLRTLPPDGYLPGINDGRRDPMPAAFFRDGVRFFGRQEMRHVLERLILRTATVDAPAPAPASAHLPASGFSVMRSDWSTDAAFMLINHGPSGGGHSHVDALSFELHALGSARAIDAGIGLSYDDPLHRAWYVTPEAHNMLSVDGCPLDRKAAEGRDVAWQSTDALDFFAATHRGYAASAGIVHRRYILFLKPHIFVIYDVIDAQAAGEARGLSWNLHLPAGGLAVVPSDAAWTLRQDKGAASIAGIAGFDAGALYAEIPWLRYQRTIVAGETAAFAVALLPHRGDPPRAILSPIPATAADGQFLLEYDGARRRIEFHPDRAIVQEA